MGRFVYLPVSGNILNAPTPSSGDAAYPVANLSALPISKPFRFTGCAAETLAWDLLTPKAADLFALINTNLTSAATATVKAGSTAAVSDWSGSILWREWDQFLLEAAVQTWRYWELDLADAANPAGYIEIGYALFGVASRPAVDFGDRWEIADIEETLSVESEFGSPNVQPLASRTRIAAPFPNMLEGDFAAVRAAWRALHADANPLFLIPDPDVYEGWFGRWTNRELSRRFGEPSSLGRVVAASLEFLSDGRGNRLSA